MFLYKIYFIIFFGFVSRNLFVCGLYSNESIQINESFMRPVLDRQQDQYIVSSGDYWNVKCTGSAPLTWSFPNCESFETNNNRIKISFEEFDSNYISYLEITSLEYFDTGYYVCYYQESYSECSDDLYDRKDVASTYLFAKDSKNLLTLENHGSFRQYNLHEGRSTDIECKPTDPSVKIQFLLHGRDISNSLESFDFRYDDKRGLISVSGSPKQEGTLICNASRDDVEQMLIFQLAHRMSLYEYIGPDGYGDPKASGPCQRELFSGENISLECSWEIDRRAPHIILQWELKGSENQQNRIIEESDHYTIIPNLTSVKYGWEIFSKYTSFLTIQNLRKDDIGIYECFGIVAETNERSLPGSYILEDVRVDENEVFISDFKDHRSISLPDLNNCVEDCTAECLKLNKCDLTWILQKSEDRSVFAAPNPSYTWYKPNGKRIDVKISEVNKKASYGHYSMEIFGDCREDMKLVKQSPKLEDMGEYILNIDVTNPVTSEEKSKNISLVMVYNKIPTPTLKIKEVYKKKNKNKKKMKDKLKPRLKTNITTFYRANAEHNISCKIEGYPLNTEEVQMTFLPCSDLVNDICQEEPKNIKLEPWFSIDGLVNEKYSYLKKTRYKERLNESGILACSICSSGGNCGDKRISSTKIYLSDYDEGFEVQGPKDNTAIELETITLLCAASKYLYKSVSWFKQNDDDPSKWESINEIYIQTGNQVEIDETPNTNFSYISTIKFPSIQMDQKGGYQCRAFPKNDGLSNTIETVHLDVLKSIPPRRTSTFNMNDTNKCTERSCTEGLDTLILDCTVTGRPIPNIKWRFKAKDDEDFKDFPPNSTFFEQIEFLENGHKLQFHALWKEQSGIYQCIASSVAGKVVGERRISIKKHSPITKGLIAGVVIGVLVLIALIIFLSYKLCWYNKQLRKLTDIEMKMFEEGDIGKINPTLGVDDQADLLPYNKEFEFDRRKLELGDQIGSGAFGRVLKATADGIVHKNEKTQVAVKMVKRDADITYIKALMAELKIMIHLGKHLNIVNLLGACTTELKKKRELLVIVEYCRFGNIQKYMMTHRNHFINQIDPATQEANFAIGQEIIWSLGGDLPRARQQYELSARYYGNRKGSGSGLIVSNSSRQMTNLPHIGNNIATQTSDQRPNVEGYTSDGGCLRRGDVGKKVGPKLSVRYTENPVEVRQKSCDNLKQKDEEQTTDMTTLPPETPTVDTRVNSSGGAVEIVMERLDSKDRYARTMSTSSQQGPGWRANVRGDYNTETIRPVATKDLLCWAYQVAKGMEYLDSQRVMHGDLACRNVLLADNNVIKICDFGLAKDIYKTDTYRKKTDGPLPVKWMAIESLQDRIFSTQSDVWSYGIVLWEMFSLGQTPYPGMAVNEVFYNRLKDGYRMEKPTLCPNSVYSIMLKCWDGNPEKRPSFTKLVEEFETYVEEGDQNQYLSLHGKFEDEWHRPISSSPSTKTSLKDMVKRTSSNLFKSHDLRNNHHSTLINNPAYTSRPSGLLGSMGSNDISRQISIDSQQQPLIGPADGYLSPICANPQFFKNVKEDNDEYLVANTSTTQPHNRISDESVDRATENGLKDTDNDGYLIASSINTSGELLNRNSSLERTDVSPLLNRFDVITEEEYE